MSQIFFLISMFGRQELQIQIPELILVAIPNIRRTHDLTPIHTTRSYGGKEEPNFSSSGGRELFLRFLEEELIPPIEAEYRT